jgi:hypothetical protein
MTHKSLIGRSSTMPGAVDDPTFWVRKMSASQMVHQDWLEGLLFRL